MGLRPDQIDGFMAVTIPLFKRHKWTDLSMEFPNYVASEIINSKKVVEDGGTRIEFSIRTKNTGLARNTGFFAADVTKVEDTNIRGVIPWAMQTTNYSYDIYLPIFQSDRETIVRWMVQEEHGALNDMAELNEENLWSAPVSTADDRPMGIPFWMQKNATADPDGGFHGGNPAGFDGGAAGVSSATYPRWRNWTFGYSGVNHDDLIPKLKKAIAFTNFIAPVPHPDLGVGKSECCIYTTYRIAEQTERLAELRNQNHHGDLARYQGMTTVGGCPIKWVNYLEANDTSDPLYGVNWRHFRPFVKKGCNMRRNPPKIAAKQHTVREVHFDNSMNYACYNRRATFVGSRPTS